MKLNLFSTATVLLLSSVMAPATAQEPQGDEPSPDGPVEDTMYRIYPPGALDFERMKRDFAANQTFTVDLPVLGNTTFTGQEINIWRDGVSGRWYPNETGVYVCCAPDPNVFVNGKVLGFDDSRARMLITPYALMGSAYVAPGLCEQARQIIMDIDTSQLPELIQKIGIIDVPTTNVKGIVPPPCPGDPCDTVPCETGHGLQGPDQGPTGR